MNQDFPIGPQITRLLTRHFNCSNRVEVESELCNFEHTNGSVWRDLKNPILSGKDAKRFQRQIEKICNYAPYIQLQFSTYNAN